MIPVKLLEARELAKKEKKKKKVNELEERKKSQGKNMILQPRELAELAEFGDNRSSETQVRERGPLLQEMPC